MGLVMDPTGDGSRPSRGTSESTSIGLVGDPGTLFRTFENLRGKSLSSDDEEEVVDNDEVADAGRL